MAFPTSMPFTTDTPVSAPVPGMPLGTADPSSSDSFQRVAVTPFKVTYGITGASTNPTAEQMEEVVGITLNFLNDYMASMFEMNDLIQYDSLVGTRTEFSPDFTEIEYIAAARFLRDSMFIPSMAELDTLIFTAFQQPGVTMLLMTLSDLPTDNPYSKTSVVSYAATMIRSSSMDKGSGFGAIAGITSAFLVAFFVTGAAAAYRWGACDCLGKKYKRAPQQEKLEENLDIDSTCTSSVGSPSSKVDEDGYRSKIIDEDVEIEFVYPKEREVESADNDPLFHSPFLSPEEGRRRDNV